MNFSKNLNFNIINLIIVLIIPFFIWGPFVPDLVVSLFSLVFLVNVFKDKLFFYLTRKPVLIFFIFCLYCILVSLFVAKDKLLSFENSLFYFRIGVFSCLIWYLIEQDKKILQYFYYALVLCFVALVVDGYIQYFVGENILGFPKLNGNRISSFFGDEPIMGSYLSRLFPLLFALFLIKEKKRFETYFIGLLFVLIDVLIYMSGERTAFFYLNLSTLFIIILIYQYQKFRLLTFIIAIAIIGTLTLTNDKLKTRMITKPATNMGFIESDQKKYIFTKVHDSHIKTAFNMFLDKPVFGHGPKMFRVICKDKKYGIGVKPCSTHPHNFYIQLLAETGTIGFLFLFSALMYVIYCSLRQLKTILFKEQRYLTDYQVCLLACFLITVWPLSPNGNFFNNWLMICYSLPVGFYLHSIYGKNRKEVLKE
jgi:O-antigen ligase